MKYMICQEPKRKQDHLCLIWQVPYFVGAQRTGNSLSRSKASRRNLIYVFKDKEMVKVKTIVKKKKKKRREAASQRASLYI